jgi:hypothetical protein
MTLPTLPLKQNGTPPTGAVGLNELPRKTVGGLTVKIPAAPLDVAYEIVEVLTITIAIVAIARVSGFVIEYSSENVS